VFGSIGYAPRSYCRKLHFHSGIPNYPWLADSIKKIKTVSVSLHQSGCLPLGNGAIAMIAP
jgi:hypothetical protein